MNLYHKYLNIFIYWPTYFPPAYYQGRFYSKSDKKLFAMCQNIACLNYQKQLMTTRLFYVWIHCSKTAVWCLVWQSISILAFQFRLDQFKQEDTYRRWKMTILPYIMASFCYYANHAKLIDICADDFFLSGSCFVDTWNKLGLK